MHDAVEAIVRDRPADVPAVAVGVLIDGDAEYAADGVTDVAHPSAVDASTLFQLGSVSKTFTATTALALVEHGVLSLDGLVAPWFDRVDFGAAGATLTLRHLLTHRGGWQGDWALFNAPPTREARALHDLTAMTARVPRYGAPGGPFSYDNFGYCVLGALIEAASGQVFDEAVRSLVLEPLGLDTTVFRADDAAGQSIAIGHRSSGNGDGVRPAEGSEPWADEWPTRRALWPTGGVVSSLTDTMRWAKFHLEGYGDRTAPISAATRTAMQQPQAASGGQGAEVGLGWHIRRASGTRVLAHTGAAQGFFAQVLIVPDRSAALVVLTNGANGPAVAEPLGRWLVEQRLGLAHDSPKVIEQPPGGAGLVGTYEAVSRTIRLHVRSTGELVAEVDDTGPTWNGSRVSVMRFAEGDRLVGADDPTFRMEYGTFTDGTHWLRHRGRVHVPPVSPAT